MSLNQARRPDVERTTTGTECASRFVSAATQARRSAVSTAGEPGATHRPARLAQPESRGRRRAGRGDFLGARGTRRPARRARSQPAAGHRPGFTGRRARATNRRAPQACHAHPVARGAHLQAGGAGHAGGSGSQARARGPRKNPPSRRGFRSTSPARSAHGQSASHPRESGEPSNSRCTASESVPSRPSLPGRPKTSNDLPRCSTSTRSASAATAGCRGPRSRSSVGPTRLPDASGE